MNDNVILSLEGLSAGYGGSNTISNINLSLTAGEALCVVGQSGCGKSTLLKSVIGVLDKPVITGGDIVFDGQRLYELSQKRRCALTTSGMGFIFQTPGAAFTELQKAVYRNPEKSGQIRKRSIFAIRARCFFKAGSSRLRAYTRLLPV